MLSIFKYILTSEYCYTRDQMQTNYITDDFIILQKSFYKIPHRNSKLGYYRKILCITNNSLDNLYDSETTYVYANCNLLKF